LRKFVSKHLYPVTGAAVDANDPSWMGRSRAGRQVRRPVPATGVADVV